MIKQENIDMMCVLLEYMNNEQLTDEIINVLTDQELNKALRKIVEKFGVEKLNGVI